MSFIDGKMPRSTDLVELRPSPDGEGVICICQVCNMQIGRAVRHLNQAIRIWTDHQEEEKKRFQLQRSREPGVVQ